MPTPVSEVVAVLRQALDLLAVPTPGVECCITPLPCRTAVYLGGEVPWDTCESCGDTNGMLYAKLVSIDPVTGGDQGNCQTYNWTAEIGILRCVASLSGSGDIPSAAAVEADSAQQARDADAIFAALSCCDARSEELKQVQLRSWSPLGPDGKCAGGAWLLRGGLSVCC